MDTILLERFLAAGKLDVLSVDAWPIKKLAVGENIQHYKLSEQCYVIAGTVELIAENQEPVTAQREDLFIIPADNKVR